MYSTDVFQDNLYFIQCSVYCVAYSIGGSVVVAITYGFPMRYPSFFGTIFFICILVFCLLSLVYFVTRIEFSEHWPPNNARRKSKPVALIRINSSTDVHSAVFVIAGHWFFFLGCGCVKSYMWSRSIRSLLLLFLLLTPKPKFKSETFFSLSSCEFVLSSCWFAPFVAIRKTATAHTHTMGAATSKTFR